MRVLQGADIDYRLTPLHAKLNMFKMLQGFLVAFVSIDVIFRSASTRRNEQRLLQRMAFLSLLIALCSAIPLVFLPSQSLGRDLPQSHPLGE